MRTFGPFIAYSLALGIAAFADTASTVYPDPVMSRAMVAAGGLTTLTALCPDFPMSDKMRNHLLDLEAVLKMNPVYTDFFDQGVADMTDEALRNPNACQDAIDGENARLGQGG